MNVLVLGGDGFLGSHLVDQALAQGYEVTVFDRFVDGRLRNLEHVKHQIQCIPGDFTNTKSLRAALVGQDVVYHFITVTNPTKTWNHPEQEIQHTLQPALQFYQLAAEAGVKKIVFPSSGGTVYGPKLWLVNEEVLPDPFSPHGIVKLCAEHFLRYARGRWGISADIYRIGNAYGPRQPLISSQGVIAVWMRQILEGDCLQVFGDKKTIRDYVYVEDVARLMLWSLELMNTSETFNIGTGRGVSIFELLDIFKKSIDRPIRYKILPRRHCDSQFVVLESTRILSHFPGFKFKRIEDMIPITWNYVIKQYRRTS